jgi:adenylate cyclase
VPGPERRLAAVVAADMVGYSRLMEADETGTLARLKTHRIELIDPAIVKHRGRMIKTAGDGMLVEFHSVVDAVVCAAEIQRRMARRNADVSSAGWIQFRIGINLGDVMVEGDDVYGDGVNIAARLQELAEPGGILISGPVYEQVHNKLSIGFDCLGEQRLKNVAIPVTGYRVLQGDAPSRPKGSAHEATREPPVPPRPAEAGFSRVWDWYTRLPRTSAAMIAIAVFLFAVNMFSGPRHIWFHWPVAVLLLIAVLRARSRSGPS